MKVFITKNIFILIGILFIFLVWGIANISIGNEYVLPSIINVFKALGKMLTDSDTYYIVFNTLSKLLITLIVSFLISIILVIGSAYSNKFEEAIRPTIILLKTIPVAAVIIIFLVIIGNKVSPYIISSLVIIPIMYEAINNGVKSIDKNIIDELRMNSRINLRVIIRVLLPLASAFIMTSIIQSIGLGLKVMVMAEFIVQPKNTIGYEMLTAKNFLYMDQVFAWTFILIGFVLIVEILVKKAKKRFLK